MIRVLIVADIRLYREGLAHILAREGHVDVVAAAANSPDALALVRDLRPDIVLLDMVVPDSLATVRTIRRETTDVRVVALGLPDNDQEVLSCAEAGVTGYVHREASVADLVATAERVARGEPVCPPAVTAALLRRVARVATIGDAESGEHLTLREQEIVRLIDQGLSNKEIAARLCIELGTVKNHVANALHKLHVHRRGQAAARLRAVDRSTR